MKYRGISAALLLMLPLGCVGAEPEWLRLKSSNFEIFSSVGAQETHKVAEHLELATGVFATILGAAPPQSEPIRVVIFRTRKDYDRYSPIEAAVAHYARNSGRDYIAIANAGDGVLPSALHELFHASARRSGWTLPVWLDEGLAEVYSTFRYSGGKLLAGAAIPSRRLVLETDAWTSLPDLLGATHESEDYNRKDRRQGFYNESWALAHMLVFHPSYAPSFPRVLDRLRNGETSKAVLEDTYGKPVKAIEADLAKYVRTARLREKQYDSADRDAQAESSKPFEITRAPRFYVELAMLDLNNHEGSDRDAKNGLEGLAAANPERPEPWVSLGYFAQRHGLAAEMDRSFSKAVDLGSRNPVMLWDYARLAAPEHPANAVRAVVRLIEMRPGDQPALLLLAEIQTQMRQFRAAIETLAAYGNVRVDDRLHYFRTTAIAKSELDDRAGSRAAALEWRALANGIEDRDKADRVLKYLDSLDDIDRSVRASLQQTG